MEEFSLDNIPIQIDDVSGDKEYSDEDISDLETESDGEISGTLIIINILIQLYC